MAAPRASSFKALRNLQKGSRTGIPSKRSLHLTGSQASPSPIDPSNKTAYTPWTLQDLRGECNKRTLSASGTKHELIDRLAGHDSLQARAFSIAMRRIAREETRKPVSGPSETPLRHEFNTSRALKAVGDTSTVDFAYFPKLFAPEFNPEPAAIRVPILPHVDSDSAEAVFERYPELDAAAGGYQDTNAGNDGAVLKPEISAINGDTASAMSDVHDGHHIEEMSVEALTSLTETVSKSARQFVDKAQTNDSTVRQIWDGFLDDLLGPKGKPRSA